MKSSLILKTDRDSPTDGETDFPHDLMQPVLEVNFHRFRSHKPAIQPGSGTGGNPVSQDLAACHHAANLAHNKITPLTGYWQGINNNWQNERNSR